MNLMPGPLCSVCGRQQATYVCQNCGRPTCRDCFDATTWTCRSCLSTFTAQPQQRSYGEPLQFGLPSILLMLAFATVFIGVLLIALGSLTSGNLSGGAIILIGPIPIILGGGPNSIVLVEIAAVLTIAAIILFLLLRRRF